MPSGPALRRRPVAVFVILALAVTVAGLATVNTGGATPLAAFPSLTLHPVATLASPIAMATRVGSDDLFVAERAGRVRRLHVNAGVVTLDPVPLLDVTGYVNATQSGGLLGLAFDPTGARLYLHYTNANSDTRVVEYTMSNGGTGATVDLSTRRVVLKVHQDFSYHKGGDLSFGPDGRLYLALGDGDADPTDGIPVAAQDLGALLGKILRINPRPSATRPYRNPLGNPFVGHAPARAEIWLYGVRNPWRFSFDRATGDLYVADVGEHTTEELDVLLADSNGRNAGRGANLGWSAMEGNQPFHGGAEPVNHTRPVFTYPHVTGGACSIIGGYVYRGSTIPSLAGTYVYGDRCTGQIGGIVVGGAPAVAPPAAPETTSVPDLGISAGPMALQSFGQGPDGELYVLTGAPTDNVSRIEAIP